MAYMRVIINEERVKSSIPVWFFDACGGTLVYWENLPPIINSMNPLKWKRIFPSEDPWILQCLTRHIKESEEWAALFRAKWEEIWKINEVGGGGYLDCISIPWICKTFWRKWTCYVPCGLPMLMIHFSFDCMSCICLLHVPLPRPLYLRWYWHGPLSPWKNNKPVLILV